MVAQRLGAMGYPDPNISNGDCYYMEDKRLDKAFIPCGNDDLGPKPCCQTGDVCLENNACYNADYGTTYLAGCTDKTFEDTSCPQKSPWDGSKWVGLIYMNNNRWGICHQRAEPSLLESPDPCPKPTGTGIGTYVVAFAAPSVTPDVGRLPLSLGGSMSWNSGRIPPTPTGLDPQPPATASRASTATATSTSSSSPVDNSTTGGGNGGATGIVVGVVVGVFVLGIFVAGYIYYRRRKREDVIPTPSAAGDSGNKFDPNPTHHPHGPREPVLPVRAGGMGSLDLAPAKRSIASELPADPARWSSPAELYGGGVRDTNVGPQTGYRRSGISEGAPRIKDVFPHIGSPIVNGGAFSPSGTTFGSIVPQPGVMPTSPSSITTATTFRSDPHASLVSDGAIRQHDRVISMTPNVSEPAQQYQSPNAYPGQPLPYQQYFQGPLRGQQEQPDVPGGISPTFGLGTAPASGQHHQTSSNCPIFEM